MASYKIEWKKSAVKELRKSDKSITPKIVEAVDSLAIDPIPKGTKKASISYLKEPFFRPQNWKSHSITNFPCDHSNHGN